MKDKLPQVSEEKMVEQLWSITEVEGKPGLSRIDEKILKQVINKTIVLSW